MGGASTDSGNGIAVDSSGNIYTTGIFQGPADFDPGAGTANLTFLGNFISKLDTNGNFIWAKKIGGSEANSITLDLSNNVYTTGSFGRAMMILI
ncbi:MAG: SBBP repeat-containing protein [Anaerolineales bacterium]|nr:SBBP repeat-containing protein [Anaerolineales bacterium]